MLCSNVELQSRGAPFGTQIWDKPGEVGWYDEALWLALWRGAPLGFTESWGGLPSRAPGA